MLYACRSHFDLLYLAFAVVAGNHFTSKVVITENGFATPFDGGSRNFHPKDTRIVHLFAYAKGEKIEGYAIDGEKAFPVSYLFEREEPLGYPKRSFEELEAIVKWHVYYEENALPVGQVLNIRQIAWCRKIEKGFSIRWGQGPKGPFN